jgi:hypothetical protein
VCLQHQWISTPTIYYCLECFLHEIGERFLPDKLDEDYYCHLCEEPVQAGDLHVKFTFMTGITKPRIFIYHQNCFVECAGEDFWRDTVKLF